MKMVKIYSDKVTIKIDNNELDHITINDLLLLDDNEQNVVAIVTGLIDNDVNDVSFEDDVLVSEAGSVKTIECDIIGCLKNKGKFTNSIDLYPTSNVQITEITTEMFESMLSDFANGFCIGEYTNYGIPAHINGNKFFQRHACIIGNTGSGKSETVAKILEEVSGLPKANVIVFDIHGEYKNLSYAKQIGIGDTHHFPYWFFSLQDIMSNILKIKEETAVTIPSAIRKAFAEETNGASTLKPVKFDWKRLTAILDGWDKEIVHNGFTKEGEQKTKQGELYGKLISAVSSMTSKLYDARYSFMFEKDMPSNYLETFVNDILSDEKPVKNIDLSELPHEMIIPVIGTIVNLIYTTHVESKNKIPLTIVCDEAHVYIPNNFNLSASERRTVEIFEIIAKEGRKFGVTLFPASQRPSELNKTIIAQCGNFIIGKLNNENDKAMMKGMLPEGISGIIESVTMFNAGDVLVLGDSVPIPLKIHVDLAEERPDSRTIDFWSLWEDK